MNKDVLVISRIEETKAEIKRLKKEIEFQRDELALHLCAFTGQFLHDSDLEDANINWIATNEHDKDLKFIKDE